MALQNIIQQLRDLDLNDLDWSRMGVWPLAGKVALCVILAAAIGIGGYFLFVKDLNLQLERVTSQEETLKNTFRQKSFQAANLEAYREQMEEMEKSFGALVGQLPSDTEVPGLLEDIDEKGSEAGLEISSITLQAEKSAEFYVELPISIQVTGPYHDFGVFVSGVAGMPRIVTLHDYTIKKNNQSGLLDMTILAKTYRYRTEGSK